MKRKIMITIALALSIFLVSLMSSDSSVQAQRQPRFTADTGVITPGPNQRVRLSVVGDWNGDGRDDIGLRAITYSQGNCSPDGVCIHTPSSQTSSRIMPMPGEAATFDIPNTGSGVRGIVTSNRPMVVNAQIIDVETGNVDAIIAILIS